jgi:hypothetical protein
MSGAWSGGKGDMTRPSDFPWEVRDLLYDRALGHITQKQFNAQIEAAWARARKRGWRGNRM